MTYEEIETTYDCLTNEEKMKYYLVEDSEDNIYLIPADMLDMFKFLDGLIWSFDDIDDAEGLVEVWNYIFEEYDVG
jgi:uncharacterized protein YehS (DUF1456 family)